MKNSQSARNIANLERLFMQAIENRQGARSGDGQYAIVEETAVVDLSNDSELAKRVKGLSKAEKNVVIQQYILDALGDEPFRLSDGKIAVVDRSDAHHIAYGTQTKKDVAQVAEVKRLVENARFYAEATDVTHKKFDYFSYYEAVVRYQGEEMPIYLNVGRAKNDHTYHLYDIKVENKKHRQPNERLQRPKPNEGYALESGVSDTKIPQNAGGVNTQSMQEGADYSQNALLPRQYVQKEKAPPKG